MKRIQYCNSKIIKTELDKTKTSHNDNEGWLKLCKVNLSNIKN